MCPTFFRWGPVAISSWSVMYVIGVTLGIFACLRIDEKQKLGIGKIRIIYLHIYVTLIGLLGAQLFHWFEFILMPDNRGKTYYGGVLFVILFVIIIAKWWRLSARRLLDLVCISASVGGVFLRAGCLLNGCCKGRITDNLFAIKYPVIRNEKLFPTLLDLLFYTRWQEYQTSFQDGIYVHPAPIYYSIGFLLIFTILYLKRRQINFDPGIVSCTWLTLHGILRVLIEIVRMNPPYFFWRVNLAVVLSLSSIFAGIIIMPLYRSFNYNSSIALKT